MPVLALLLLARPALGQPPLFSVSVTPSERGFKYTIELKAERTVDVVVAASVYVPGRGWGS
jgi:hypothetical protein